MRIQIDLERNYCRIWLAVIAVSALCYLTLIDGNSVWLDEAYTMAMVEHGYTEIWRITAADVHPPLYYFLLKAFLDVFGHSIFLGKFFSAIPYVAVTAVGGWQLRKLFDARTALWFCILWAFYPFALRYSVETRMYSWAALFVFISCVYACRAYEEGRLSNWAILTVSTLAAAYTQYFALVSVGIVYLILMVFILMRKRTMANVVPLAVSVALCFIGYVPWFGEFFKQLAVKVTTEYWIGAITIITVVGWVGSVFRSVNYMGSLVFALVSLLLFISLCLKRGERLTIALLALEVPVGTALIGLAASIAVRPVFIVRYLVPSAPCVALFLALGFESLDDRDVKLVIASVLLTLFVTSFFRDFSNIWEERGANVLNSAFVQRYNDASCFISETESLHPGGILAYESDKPVYYAENPYGANPFSGRYALGDLDIGSIHERAILVTDENVFPSDFFTSNFNVRFLEELDNSYDVYEVLPRQ